MKIRVITDSGSGLSQKQAQALDIDYLPLQVIINEKTYLDGVDMNTDMLYDEMEKGAMPQTSQPPMGMIEELLESYHEQEVTDIVLITLSSGLSGTNENVCAAAKRHDIQVHTVDICSTLAMEGYMAKYAKILVDQGCSGQQVIEKIQECVDASSGYLIVDDLQHLAHGGRLTPMAAKLGGMLRIKPILEVNKKTQGKVDIFEKVRTMSKAIKLACETVRDMEGMNEQDFTVVIMDSRAKDQADLAQSLIEEMIPGVEIERQDLCAVINCHTGMKSVGIQAIKKI